MISTGVTVLSDGTMRRDAGSMFGTVPKVRWENLVATDRKNRMALGLNSLLVRTGRQNILIDTGVGSKEMNGHREEFGLGPSRLMKELRQAGLSHKDIDIVILSRLDFDHAGGCSRLDRAGDCVPTFPRAIHYAQRACLDDVHNPNERCHSLCCEEDLEPLEERGQIQFLDGDSQVLPGVEVISTGGPCRGHLVVLVTLGGERIAFLGDLVPTHFHLNMPWIPAYDQFPEETLAMKREILDRAERGGWLLVFGHDHDQKAGYLERRNGERIFRPIDIALPVAA